MGETAWNVEERQESVRRNPVGKSMFNLMQFYYTFR